MGELMQDKVEIRVSGRVQGVAFRWYTQRQARVLNLTGWVRNQTDGSVCIQAEGIKTDLLAFIDYTAIGPEHAVVEKQEVFWDTAEGTYTDFLITG